MMINPKIIVKKQPYPTEESCLSLNGTRSVQRYAQITVKFQNENFEWQTQNFTDFVAQVIQNEIDHCNGILI